MLDLDMAQVQLHNGLDMLYIVREAMAENPDRQTDYADALYGVYDYLTIAAAKISESFERIRKEINR